MKRVNALFLLITVTFLVVRCTYTDNQLEIEEENIIFPVIPGTILPDEPLVPDSSSLNYRKFIYLTIDDAPLNGSEYINNIILDSKIKTNLFMVGKTIHESGKFLKYYENFKANPYIEIYNHSYSHANHKYGDYYKHPELVLEDFDKNQSECNILYKIARLPGRNLWHIGEKKKNHIQTGSEAADLLVENGYNIYGWDVEWKYNAKDYTPQQSIDELVQEIEDRMNQSKTFTPDHIILLAHDQMFAKINNNNNLAELIIKLEEKNYLFGYLSAYPGQKK